MKIFLVFFLVLCFLQSNQSCGKKVVSNEIVKVSPTTKKMKFENLPDNITPETEVLKEIKNEKGEVVSSKKTTAENLLTEMKASYRDGKLVDEKGKEIRFFQPDCVGTSRADDEDQRIQDEKRAELAELKKKYTVISVYCDPLKVF